MHPRSTGRRLVALLLPLAMIAACTSGDETATTTAPPTSDETTTTAATPTTAPMIPVEVAAVPFGTLEAVDLISDTDPYPGPEHPRTMDGVVVIEWIDSLLNDRQATATLTNNGFVIVPGSGRHFHPIYEGTVYDGYPVFVTTDTAYHVWHLAFSKILRETEQQVLLPELESMVARLVELARTQAAELDGTSLGDEADRVAQFYEAAAVLLELDVGPVGPLAEAEVELARAADTVATSPTIGVDLESDFLAVRTDYSLFRPRGHYTRNADLERYFRAMSQLGNNGILVRPETLPLAVLAARVLTIDADNLARWQRIYEPTAFLVGAADDYTPTELVTAVSQVVPEAWEDLEMVADESVLEEIADTLLGTRPVAVNPEAASVRIMGTRLVIDAYILDQLVMPNVAERTRGSALDVAAAFDSAWALARLEERGDTDHPGFVDQLDLLRAQVTGRTIADWGRTVYDAWLYAIEPAWKPHGPGFPGFMQTPAWDAKSHQTGLGSYAELKHDTILYAKQAVAEGGGEQPPIPPRHWVEPDPVVFGRLASVADLLHAGLESRGLLDDDYAALLTELADLYRWLAGIAADELAAEPISAADNDRLAELGATLEGLWIRTSDLDLDIDDGPDDYAALVADIMRDQEQVLEVGTGYVDTIFVLVPTDDGTFQVAAGAVYSFYEFWSDQRLTDAEWRQLLEEGEAPARPDWQQIFLAEE